MKILITIISFGFIALANVCCNEKGQASAINAVELLHDNEKKLTDVIIYDVFTPPVASRIYAYTSLAAHEAIRHLNPGEPSIVAKLKGFSAMPEPEKGVEYDFTLAAFHAFFKVAGNVIFSKDTLKLYEEPMFAMFRERVSEEVYQRSVAFGDSVGTRVADRLKKDNYKETRGMPKNLGSLAAGKWRPTSPDYIDGVEPYWMKIKAMALDSSSQFDPGPPPSFSTDTTGVVYKMNKEVCDIGKNLTKEQKDIAYFWDDNPFVFHHAGHMAFNTKKQTPGGHWMGITAIACRKTNADAVKTARAYALVAIGLLDGFISCWDTKYRYNFVRPMTFINELIDKSWEPYLQTPPFPEYTSGHSTISASAATVLTGLFGDNFAFHDDADKEYIGMERDFTSFMQAAQEASISRLYGGIHYRISLDKGVEAGKKIGAHVLKTCN